MSETQAPEILQFGIQQGQVDLGPAQFAAVDPAAHRSWRGLGYLLLAIDAPGTALPSDVCDSIFRAMADAYYSTARGSITRAVHAAVVAGNEGLFEHNVRADAEHTLAAGLNCAAVRDGEAYAAQYGPALALYIHEGKIAYSPSDSPWLKGDAQSWADGESPPMCGSSRRVEPKLFHIPLQPGDTLILGSTSLIRSADPRGLAAAVRTSVSLGWEAAIGSITGSEMVGGALYRVPVTTTPPIEEPVAVPEEPAEEPKGKPEEQQVPEPKAPKAPASVSAAPAAPVDEKPFLPEPESSSGVPRSKPAPSRKAPPSVDLGGLGKRVGEGASKAWDRASDALLEALPRELPEQPEPTERVVHHTARVASRVLFGLAIAIPLAMLAMVVAFRVQASRLESQHIRDIYTRAANAWDSAQATEDSPTARRFLLECLDAVAEGLAFDSEHTGLADLSSRATRRLDQLDRVERLYHVWQIAEIPHSPGTPLDSARIVLRDNEAYVLDRGSDTVCRFVLNDVGDALQDAAPDPVILEPGDELAGIVASDIVDIAWIEAGGVRRQSTFAALERSGSLIEFLPQAGISLQPVANSDAWLGPVAMGAYYGNLYVLDPLMGRILKYTPVDDAYTTPPVDYLGAYQGVDLTGAVDMAVDGNLYVLYADGSVQKYLAGEAQPFAMSGLPDAMDSPRAIFVSGEQEPDAPGFVYVADTGNERILQFDKQGNYLRQFRANVGQEVLCDLQGLFVDEETGRLFVVSGRTLLLTAITPYPGGSDSP
jgi:hypothetical protein